MFKWMITAALVMSVHLANAQNPFTTEVVADLHEPWAMAVLPDDTLLVTEKKGSIQWLSAEGKRLGQLAGVPDVDYGGQGGLGDIALHPAFEDNNVVYLSYVEAGVDNTRGAAVARGTLNLEGRRPKLTNVDVIWRQYPKVLGRGHFGHRILFDDAGYLWISSGDRQKFTPAQDMQSNMGKILRLNDDGSTPADNPFVNYASEDPLVDDESTYDQVWSLGHRNPLGMDFDSSGRLWVMEMGPAGGDELNLVKRGANYGYPLVSDGNHYDGRLIPAHSTRTDLSAPALTWKPVVSPADLLIYTSERLVDWKGDALIAGLSARGIVRVSITGEQAIEVERYPMDARIRSLAQALDGSLWALEDERGDSRGRLLKLQPLKRQPKH